MKWLSMCSNKKELLIHIDKLRRQGLGLNLFELGDLHDRAVTLNLNILGSGSKHYQNYIQILMAKKYYRRKRLYNFAKNRGATPQCASFERCPRISHGVCSKDS